MIKEYVVIDAPISVASEGMHNPPILYRSHDKEEIKNYMLGEMMKHFREGATVSTFDKYMTVESYYVDEEGEFIAGSDYDIPSNWLKNIENR